MVPFLAQGAAVAIEDGMVLARCLEASPDDPAAALASYERARRERATRLVRAAAAQIDRLHGRTAMADQAAAKTHMTRSFQGERIEELYAWLYGYDALTVPLQ